jgi:hypothetical protein
MSKRFGDWLTCVYICHPIKKIKKMKKLIATFLVLFASVSFINAQEPVTAEQPENPNAPKIEFTNKVINYGDIDYKADSNREFEFVNKGKEPLILTSVRASCGCTTPSWTREPVAPGAKGIIKVKYDTGRVGNFTKTITVQSNASNGTVTLQIKGKVGPKPTEQTAPTKSSTSKVSKSS